MKLKQSCTPWLLLSCGRAPWEQICNMEIGEHPQFECLFTTEAFSIVPICKRGLTLHLIQKSCVFLRKSLQFYYYFEYQVKELHVVHTWATSWEVNKSSNLGPGDRHPIASKWSSTLLQKVKRNHVVKA